MLQDSKEALLSNVVLIQPSFLLCLLQRALAKALLPLLHPWPDLLKELRQWYCLSLRQEVTTLVASKPSNLL
jgi:hypothetical protein